MEQDRYLHALDPWRRALETSQQNPGALIQALSSNFPLAGASWADIGVPD